MENTELTVFEKIQQISLRIKVEEDAPRSDLEFKRLLQEGEEEDDIDKIYQFVEACERGRGFFHDEWIYQLISEAYEESPQNLMLVLSNKSFLEQCVLLSACRQSMIVEFIKLGAADNMRFLYECLRRTLTANYDVLKENEEVFIQGITLISIKSAELWKRWIKRYERMKSWQRLLNKVLPNLHKDAIAIYVNTIDIGMDVQQGYEIYKSIGEIPSEEMRYIQSMICTVLCQRWNAYLDELRENKPYHDKVKGLAYAGFILPAIQLCECRTQMDWEQAVLSNIAILQNHMTQWYRTYTDFRSIFWIDYTQISYLRQIGTELAYSQGSELERKIQELTLLYERNIKE